MHINALHLASPDCHVASTLRLSEQINQFSSMQPIVVCLAFGDAKPSPFLREECVYTDHPNSDISGKEYQACQFLGESQASMHAPVNRVSMQRNHCLAASLAFRYTDIKEKLTPFLRSCGYNPKKDLVFLPISGLLGDNIQKAVDPKKCPWYRGGTLFEILDATDPLPRDPLSPFRMSIIDKYAALASA